MSESQKRKSPRETSSREAICAPQREEKLFKLIFRRALAAAFRLFAAA